MDTGQNLPKNLKSRVVVIGGGQAASALVRKLRLEGHLGQISIIGAESAVPYERPPLSKGILLGTKTPEQLQLVTDNELAELRVDFHGGARAIRIDRAARTVLLANGKSVPYEKLVIATGGRPRVLELPGNAAGQVAYLRTVEDALALRQRMLNARRILIIGGGWIGLETACSARELGLEVTVVEASRRLCERTVPPLVSNLLLDRFSNDRVNVRLSTQVRRLDMLADGGLRAEFDDDIREFDLVVAGIGMVPNDELAAEAGLPCSPGLLCDPSGRTVDPDVFACGDVAAFVHPKGPSRPIRLESWENAEKQGASCALAILGKDVPTPGLPWFWSDQGDRNLQILGFPDPEREPLARAQGTGVTFFWMKSGQIEAAICIDAPSDMTVIKRLVQANVIVDSARLIDPAVSMRSLLKRVQSTATPETN